MVFSEMIQAIAPWGVLVSKRAFTDVSAPSTWAQMTNQVIRDRRRFPPHANSFLKAGNLIFGDGFESFMNILKYHKRGEGESHF